MKKHLKLLSLLSLFVIASATFFIFAKRLVDDRPETVMVNVFQKYYGKDVAWIDYGNSKIVKTDIDGFAKEDNFISSSSKILAIIQKLNSEGYKVISQSQGTTTTDTYYETLVLTLK